MVEPAATRQLHMGARSQMGVTEEKYNMQGGSEGRWFSVVYVRLSSLNNVAVVTYIGVMYSASSARLIDSIKLERPKYVGKCVSYVFTYHSRMTAHLLARWPAARQNN